MSDQETGQAAPLVEHNARRRAILRRWIDVAALSVLAGGIVLLIGTLYYTCSFAEKVSPKVIAAAALLTILTAYMTTARPRVAAVLGVRHLPSYPPFWIAGVAGAGIVLCYIAFARDSVIPHGLCILDQSALRQSIERVVPHVVAAMMILGAVWIVVRRTEAAADRARVSRSFGLSERSEEKPLSVGLLVHDFNTQRKWFSVDKPTGNPRFNAFDHNAIARRLTQHLIAPSKPSVALVGRVGSGKTTILSLTLFELHSIRRLGTEPAVVKLSLWPFDTVDAAIRGILGALTKELSRHINTIPLFGLPSEYADAIEGVSQRLSSFTKILSSPRSPSAVLQAYDDAACAIGLRIVLWIEDLERFSGLHAGGDRADQGAELTRLSPLRALMDELSECASVQVVLSASHQSLGFEMEKFARFVEGVPPLAPDSVQGILSTFRQGCLAESSGDIDPSTPELSEKLWKSESSDVVDMVARLAPQYMPSHRALSVLCSTPRTLKLALRDCHDAWRVLHGEVDFNDLLVVSILGAAEPAAKAFIAEHIRQFKYGIGTDRRDKGEISEVERAFSAVLDARNAITRAALEQLVLWLFPRWKAGDSSANDQKPQGFSATHTDYWIRYLKREPIAPQERDQLRLKTVRAWREERLQDLPELLVQGDTEERLLVFLRAQCSEHDLIELFRDIVRAERRVSPGVWKEDHYAHGVAFMWSLFLNRRIDDLASLESAVVEELAASFPDHLPTAFSLAKLFGSPSSQVPPVFPYSDAQDRFLEAFKSGLLSCYPSAPPKLVDTLRDSSIDVLYLSCSIARVLPSDAGIPQEWLLLREAILQATELDPTVMAPQLIHFVVKGETAMTSSGIVANVHFDPDAAARYFDAERLLRAIAHASPTQLSEWVTPSYEKLLEAAQLHVRASS